MDKHHHRFLFFSLVAVIVGGVIAAGGYWAYWNFYERFRPVTIAKNQTEIQRLLDEADWVSPGRPGQPLWIITYRDCAECTTYQREEFPTLAAANIDTRVIVFARPDHEGLQQSTPAERATIAELWINRDWSLYAKWMATPHKDWAADGLKASDHDFARNAVVNATRDYVSQMAPLLKGAGLGDTYPILIWRDRDGFLKACACTDERSYHFIRTDLGVEGAGAKLVDELKSAISGAETSVTNATSKTAPPTKPAPSTAAPAAPVVHPPAMPSVDPPMMAAPATSAPATSSPPAPQSQPRAANDASAPAAAAPRRHSNARAVFY